MQKARISLLTEEPQRGTLLLSVQVGHSQQKQLKLIRTDTVYSPSSTTKTILVYINTLAENHGGSSTAIQALPGQVTKFLQGYWEYTHHKIKLEVDTNLSSPNI